jgi:hypothetical protein
LNAILYRQDFAIHRERKAPQGQSKNRQQEFDFALKNVSKQGQQQVEEESGLSEVFQGSRAAVNSTSSRPAAIKVTQTILSP